MDCRSEDAIALKNPAEITAPHPWASSQDTCHRRLVLPLLDLGGWWRLVVAGGGSEEGG